MVNFQHKYHDDKRIYFPTNLITMNYPVNCQNNTTRKCKNVTREQQKQTIER